MVLHHRCMARNLWHFIINGSSSWWVFLIVGSASMALYHRWGIIIIDGASSLMSTSLMTLHHQQCFIINGSSSMALHHQWVIICGTSSSMGHNHRWGIIIDRASWSMGLPHRWGFLIALVAYHKFVLTFPCTSALNPTLQLQQQNWTNHEVPSSKMSLATIIFRWHSQKIIYMTMLLKVKDLWKAKQRYYCKIIKLTWIQIR